VTARVLVVDDSAVVRRLVASLLSEEGDLEVVGKARNGQHALAKVQECRPDVVVMDVEMPVMDGIEAVRRLRESHPRLPVIMFSTFTERGSRSAMDALGAGAAGYVAKKAEGDGLKGVVHDKLAPKLREVVATAAGSSAPARPRGTSGAASRPLRSGRELADPTSLSDVPTRSPDPVDAPTQLSPSRPAPAAAPTRRATTPSPEPGARPARRSAQKAPPGRAASNGLPVPRPALGRPHRGSIDVLAIGCSTGGPNALAEVIPALPGDLGVPVVIVQHMPPRFTRLLADRLDGLSELTVREAEAGDEIVPNTVYLAPGGYHMRVRKRAGKVLVTLDREPPVNSCRPAVDPLFWSVAEVWGGSVLGVILTGMGQDGLEGCLTLSERGASILSQDEETSVVWGMPRAIAQAGIADDILPLDQVSGAILRRVRKANTMARTG